MKNNNVYRPLPINRKQQFKEILRYHFAEIIYASLFTFIFAVPLLAWTIFVSYFSLFQDGTLMSLIAIQLGMLVSILILGVGISGGLYFFKKLIWNEGVFINQDFFIGVKKNYKDFLKLFLIIGIVYFFLHLGIESISHLELSKEIKSIFMGGGYALFILLSFIHLFMQSQNILYQGTIAAFFKNGIRFVFGTILKSTGVFALIMLPFFTYEFIPFLSAKIVTLIICMVFYFGFIELLLMLYSISVFDETINKNQYQEVRYKGINKKTIQE